MIKYTKLNVLAFFPERLNMLMELADESVGIRSFTILKNMPEENAEFYRPNDNYQVMMFDCYEEQCDINPYDYFALGVIGVESKELVYKNFKKQIGMGDEQFINLIHPTSYISKSASLGYGLQVEVLSSISVLTTIGFGVNIKRNCNIGHHCSIGDYVTINPGVNVSGFVNVGNNTMIGAGTTIKDGLTIGKNSLIGSGSNVVKDIPDNCVAYGSPCIAMRER